MKRAIWVFQFLTFFCLIASQALAQVPQKISYQAVVRNSDNELLTNTIIRTRISILQGTSGGPVVYMETHTPTTNDNGLINIQIGGGTVVEGTFGDIDWSTGSYFIKTEIDPTGGIDYTISGTNQLLSVPYALYAENAGNMGTGPEGPAGPEGKSAFDIWLEAGNTGSEEDFIASIAGPEGRQGPEGMEGKSAYQVWLDTGNTGTESDFLNSITGPVGPTGPAGPEGSSAYQVWLDAGNTGTEADFLASITSGATGAEGKSAYQVWLDNGNTGTESDFLNSLVGPMGIDGESAYQSWINAGNTGSEADFLNSLAGMTGTDGKSAYQIWLDEGNAGTEMDFLNSLTGAQGLDGISAYQVWLDEGNVGTEADFLASLVGPTGATGGYPQHFIGETYGGGIVFYVYDDGQHGLIVSASDLGSGSRWSADNVKTRAKGDGLGAGKLNTSIIISSENPANADDFAAALCNEYSVIDNGVTYGDWYLPSLFELDLLYLVKGPVGIPNQSYWSSNEFDSGQAWKKIFGDGTMTSVSKSATNRIRAIRSF